MQRFPRRTLLALGGAAALAMPTGAFAAGTISAIPSSSTASSTASSTSSTTGMGATAAGLPLPLTGPVSGQLVGKSSGAFARYQFTQTGTGSPITFLLTTDNARPLNSGAAGVEIYQNGNLLSTSSPSGPFRQTAIVAPTQGGVIVVQVFNYDPTQTITFTLTPQGLPAQPFVSPTTRASTMTAVATSSTTSRTSTARPTPTPLTGPTKGLLAGLHGGSFAYYSLPSTGNGQPVTLTLTVYPPVEVTNGAAGLNVYTPDGHLAATTKPGTTAGVAVATFISTSAGTATIQVFNYDPQTTIIYTLAPSGG